MLLMDKDTFVETDVYLEHRCPYFGMDKNKVEGDGVIAGYGKVNGRTVCVYAQDFTVFGGSISEMNARKISNIQNKALQMEVPIVGLFDSGGARVQEGILGLSGHGNIFYNNVKASGKIPQISAIMGTCAGGASYSPALTDFIIMVDETSNMFITGPKVVKAAIGQTVTMDELGGAEIHARISGMADHVAEDDEDCIGYIKRLLSYLPDNFHERPERAKEYTFHEERGKTIASLMPESKRHAYDMHKIIDCLIDEGSGLEIKEKFASNIITMLARVGGYPVGIIANQSAQMAGCIDINAADKAAGFIRRIDVDTSRHLRQLQYPAVKSGGRVRFLSGEGAGARGDYPAWCKDALCLQRGGGSQNNGNTPQGLRGLLSGDVQQRTGGGCGLCVAGGRDCSDERGGRSGCAF